ncbi:non-homologous end-joining DNA ligase LigD [Ornithinimicrobium avium]|uniref:non-homologous end-joining DNA ligase LigD n=1 Tax=Ornithinimicrobium avium TaxID=2283195 RepID=UPI001D182143|nr:hypothetical protein [Ornithinimicrobium avium]
MVDLDPGPGAGLHECARVALLVRERLESVGLATRPVTSGSKGMQLYADLEGTRSSDEVSAVAKALAEHLEQEHPDLVTAKMTKTRRPGRIFLDWSQNNAAKTTICPWSLRGRARPQVALPRTWQEVEAAAAGEVELTQRTIEEV